MHSSVYGKLIDNSTKNDDGCTFPTIPCEPHTAIRLIESHIVFEFRPCINNIVYCMLRRFEDFRTSLYVFMSVFKGFRRLRTMVNGRHLFL